MRKLFALCLLAAAGCWFEVDHGNGLLATESRGLASFQAIEVGDGIRVEAVSGGPQSVRVRTDSNLLHHLETWVSADGVLHIGWSGWGVHASTQTDVVVVAPHLTRLAASGGANLLASGFAGGPLGVELSGGSYGELHGLVDSLSVQASGGSQLRADFLYSHRAVVQASGGSRIWVRCDGLVEVDLSGGSTCTVSGRPTSIHQDVSDGSTVLLN